MAVSEHMNMQYKQFCTFKSGVALRGFVSEVLETSQKAISYIATLSQQSGCNVAYYPSPLQYASAVNAHL